MSYQVRVELLIKKTDKCHVSSLTLDIVHCPDAVQALESAKRLLRQYGLLPGRVGQLEVIEKS